MRLLCVIGLGTFGFGVADVLLEPYGGQALGFSVGQTTMLTALFAGGTLIGFASASRWLTIGGAPVRLATIGAAIGIPGFGGIILSSTLGMPILFFAGILATGFGAGLFGHGTLTATIRNAPPDQVGLSLGAWGAVQATSAGIGIAFAGIVRDILVGSPSIAGLPASTPYNIVFSVEMVFLAVTCLIAIPLMARRAYSRAARPAATSRPNPVEAQ
jgi:BCD family chlorophyll transporter-like MFS transporter